MTDKTTFNALRTYVAESEPSEGASSLPALVRDLLAAYDAIPATVEEAVQKERQSLHDAVGTVPKPPPPSPRA